MHAQAPSSLSATLKIAARAALSHLEDEILTHHSAQDYSAGAYFI
ncbi:hypothetical protein [Chromatium okenii]|nr:hypothetical protein [Chromatium okenii]